MTAAKKTPAHVANSKRKVAAAHEAYDAADAQSSEPDQKMFVAMAHPDGRSNDAIHHASVRDMEAAGFKVVKKSKPSAFAEETKED